MREKERRKVKGDNGVRRGGGVRGWGLRGYEWGDKDGGQGKVLLGGQRGRGNEYWDMRWAKRERRMAYEVEWIMENQEGRMDNEG